MTFSPSQLVKAIVVDADRRWAMAQCPTWAQCGTGEMPDEVFDDGAPLDIPPALRPRRKADWADLVHWRAEQFEAFFAPHDLRTWGDWSRIWRMDWWPRTEPHKRWPSIAPREFQPFFRKGSQEFERALCVATANERAMWARFGVAQFKPNDPRLCEVTAQGAIRR